MEDNNVSRSSKEGGELVPFDPDNAPETEGASSDSDVAPEGVRGSLASKFRPRELNRLTFLIVCLVAVAIGLSPFIISSEPGVAGIGGLTLLVGVYAVSFIMIMSVGGGLFKNQQPLPSEASVTAAAKARHATFALVDQAPNAALITGIEGNGIYANPAYYRLFNITTGHVTTLEQILAGDDEALATLYRLQREAGHGERDSEDVFLTGDALNALGDPTRGSCWLRIDARPVDQDRTYCFWEVFDITDEKTLQDAQNFGLEKSNPVTYEEVPAGIMRVDEAGNVVYANRFLREWTGRELPTEGKDLSVSNIIDPPTALEDLRHDGPIKLTCKDGSHVLVRIEAFRNEGLHGEGHERTFLIYESEPTVVVNDAAPDQDVASTGKRAEQLNAFIETAPVGIAIVDGAGVVLNSNRVMRKASSASMLPGESVLGGIDDEDRQGVQNLITAVADGKAGLNPVDAHMSGTKARICQVYASPNKAMTQGSDAAVTLYFVDSTDQKSLEMQFAQSQKMQAVGQLAGGVAHDFNNVLTAIIGYCDLLLGQHKVGDPSFADINQIKTNANRAANLVRQLLAFSRKQTLVPKVLRLSDAIAETKMLLDRLLGEKIELKEVHQRDLGLIKVDQGQLEQVIINLAVNARDAMKDDGSLTIRTYNVSAEEAKALGHSVMPSADYVCLEIEDSGCGIAQENLGKIFEPFYTTKGVGEGTGLGLSTVYGIVKQTGGFIFAESVADQGTTFRIYFQSHGEDVGVDAATQEKSEAKDLTGTGTILLVEDEDAVRAFASRALKTRGYDVIEAANGELGLEAVEEANGQIDLMISDVVMPHMDGPTMAKKVREIHPDIKIIFISGYTEDAFEDELERPEDFVFLPKPFSLKQLAAKVKDVIGDE